MLGDIGNCSKQYEEDECEAQNHMFRGPKVQSAKPLEIIDHQPRTSSSTIAPDPS